MRVAPWWVLLLSVLMPAALIGALVYTLELTAVARGGAARERLDAALASGAGDLVVIGNSIARKGVDPDALAEQLHPWVRTASNLGVDGTAAAHWYLILKYQVFEAGHRPSFVVFYGNPTNLWEVEVSDSLARSKLLLLPGSGDPLIAERVLQHSPPVIRAMRTADARYVLRDTLMDGYVHPLVGFFGRDPNQHGSASRGHARLNMAGKTLLGGAGVDGRLANGKRQRTGAMTTERTPGSAGASPEYTLVPDLVALAEQYNARVIFVASPARASTSSACEDEHRADAMLSLVNRYNVDALNLMQHPIDDEHFESNFHVDNEGRKKTTRALSQALLSARSISARSADPGQAWSTPCD